MEKKNWEISRRIYEDVCGDDYYGKEDKSYVLGYVCCTEEEVQQLVDDLNERHHSYYRRDPTEEELEFGIEDYQDENYFLYTEYKVEFQDIETFKKEHSAYF